MVSAGATCRSRPTHVGSCRTVPARTARCHRVRSPHAAHRSCRIVTSRHNPAPGDTRRHRTAAPGAVRHDPALAVPRRTIRDLLRPRAGRPRTPRQQTAPSGPYRPRDKTCGDGIGPTAVRTLNEIGVGDVFDGCTPVRDVTIYGPGGEQLASPVPPIDGEAAYGYVIPRIEFDQRLFNRALAEGAEDLQGHRFTGMRLLPDRREIDLRTVDGTELTVQARLVVGADGAYSAVRKELDPAAPSAAKNHTLLAMRAYADSPDSLPGAKFGPRLLFEFTRDLLPSYGWIFPADGGQINIGAGGPIPILRKRGIDLKVQIHVFADQMRARGIEIGELRDVRAHQLPHVAGLARLSHPRAVLLGDAAAMINPVSGEGIAYAVAAACGLAQALPDDLADADALQSALDGFERAFRRHHRAHFASICISSAMLHSKTWAGILLNAAQRDPKVLEDGVNLLFGFGRIRAGTVARTTRSGWKRPPPHRLGETVDSPRSGEPDSTDAEAPGGRREPARTPASAPLVGRSVIVRLPRRLAVDRRTSWPRAGRRVRVLRTRPDHRVLDVVPGRSTAQHVPLLPWPRTGHARLSTVDHVRPAVDAAVGVQPRASLARADRLARC